jgi:hypothetical protein
MDWVWIARPGGSGWGLKARAGVAAAPAAVAQSAAAASSRAALSEVRVLGIVFLWFPTAAPDRLDRLGWGRFSW